MKIISSPIKLVLVSGFSIVLAFFGVVPSLAVENTNAEIRSEGSVCTRITAQSKSDRAAVSDKRATLQTDFSKRLSSVSTKQTEADQKISDARTAATVKFEEKISSVEARTDLTPVQIEAITTFRADIQTAELVRTTAVDDARSAYRTALALQVATQQQALSTAVTDYQASVNAAFKTAIANCTEANTAATLATLKAAIKSAREALTTARTPDVSKDAIKALAETRNTAIKTANETFKTTVQELIATLKSALQVTATTDKSAEE